MNKNLDPVQFFFFRNERMAGEDDAPNLIYSKLLELSETSQDRKLILGLQVNIDKANSRRYDITR